jgi:hypothetical protein
LAEKETQNPGSALGEAMGACMEAALSRFIEPLVLEHQSRLMTKGPVNPKTGRGTKLLMFDEFGTKYSIDGVILNESNQPLVLLESKYIRYKKHNRDKGSWICHAHGEVRRFYSSIRSSVAVLAGNWSKTSLTMITSHNINVFLIPFERLVEVLAKRGINFEWGEKDRHLALEAWRLYSQLGAGEIEAMGNEIIESIKKPLSELLGKTLSDDVPREISRVAIEIHSNLGEVKRFEFDSREEALDFLEDFSLEEMLDHSNSFTIFDIPRFTLEED